MEPVHNFNEKCAWQSCSVCACFVCAACFLCVAIGVWCWLRKIVLVPLRHFSHLLLPPVGGGRGMVATAGIECAELANVTDPHLRVSIVSREVGGRAVFSCDHGYGLQGPQEAVCQHTGEWSTPQPTCQEVQCEPPEAPENGYVQGQGAYKAGDVVQFNCNPQFMMEGQPIIACQETGRWSGSVPKCIQACSYPGTTGSGRMSEVKFYYRIGESITFTCDPGLILRGAPMLRCLRNGKWSNAVPQCVQPPGGKKRRRRGGGGEGDYVASWTKKTRRRRSTILSLQPVR